MATKTLARSGASLLRRLLNPIPASKASDLPPVANNLSPLPLLSKAVLGRGLHREDAATLSKVEFDGLSYPLGLPSLRFFIDDGEMPVLDLYWLSVIILLLLFIE